MLKDILAVVFYMFKSKRVSQADCQVYFDKIADNCMTGSEICKVAN